MAIELLSPAGSLECGIAAFKYGADAVYLGMKQFSARADAANFDIDELRVLTGLAHKDQEHPRKVYVAVNTLVYDRELEDLADNLADVCSLGVDAIIIQDWGTYALLRRYFPAMPIHASTQMVLHNVQGMKQARELGFSRVIASRELTLQEIAAMAAVEGIELETFAHGALCYAYSGLCLLSSVLRQASGNRGECTYVCRANCRVENNGKTLCQSCNLMSMKDLALGDMVGKLREAGVASLKIEGRKKTALYVSAVTDYYRKLLDGTLNDEEKKQAEDIVKTIFSRPWTKFHVANQRAAAVTDTKTVGHRGVPVGNVLSVVSDERGHGDRLRFVLKNQNIEKHDGLQIEIPGRDKPFGFAVESIRVFQQGNMEDSQSVFEATPDSTLEVPLPDGHPELTAGLPIFCASSQKIKRMFSWPSARPAQDILRHPAKFEVAVKADSISVTVGTCGSSFGYVMPLQEKLTPARNPQTAENMVAGAFQKLGDTVFSFGGLAVSNPEGLFVPLSVLNEARRQATAQAEDGLRERRTAGTAELRPSLEAWSQELQSERVGERIILKIDRPYYLNVLSAAEKSKVSEVIFDLSRTEEASLDESLEILSEQFGRERIRLALPTIIRPTMWQDFGKAACHLLGSGWKKWQISNLGAMESLGQGGRTDSLDIAADWQLYASNMAAAEALLKDMKLSRVTLMPDDDWDNTLGLLTRIGPRADVLVYQDTPLAISDICANASMKGFCPGPRACDFKQFTVTTNKAGEKLLAVNDHCRSVYISEDKPLDRRALLPDLLKAGAVNIRLDFIWRDYTPVKVHETVRKFLESI